MVAAMAVRNKAPRALVGPLDRAAELARRMQDAEILRRGRLLHAERAADAVGQNPQLVASDAEHAGDVVAEPEYPLALDMEGPMLPLRIVLRERRAGLDRVDDNAVAAQIETRDMGGSGKGCGDFVAVAIMEIEPDIPRHVVMDQRGARCFGETRRGHPRERVDTDEDCVRRVLVR